MEKQIKFNLINVPFKLGETINLILGFFDLEAVTDFTIKNCGPKRINEFLAGRICALKALQGLGDFQELLPMAEDKSPVWPQGVAGSISHSKNLACATATRSLNKFFLGIDLEHIFEFSKVKKLKESILCRSEEKLLKLGKANVMMTLIYSAKEATFKAVYQSQKKFLGFEDLEIVSIDSAGSFLIQVKGVSKTLMGKFFLCKEWLITGLIFENS